jgi:hypothetical protein
VLQKHLAESAGGQAANGKARFHTKNDPGYRAVLASIEEGRRQLLAKPRVDMPGAVPIAQERDFGKTF